MSLPALHLPCNDRLYHVYHIHDHDIIYYDNLICDLFFSSECTVIFVSRQATATGTAWPHDNSFNFNFELYDNK